MKSFGGVDYLALTTNIAALVLAVVAIWLSIVFFKMSSALSEGTKEAAKGTGASVDRLDGSSLVLLHFVWTERELEWLLVCGARLR